jgi:predicted sugar kinase
MANNKNSGYALPATPSKNQDVKNNDIMKAFNDMKEKNRVEITSLFDLNLLPSTVPDIKNIGKSNK